ncbi:sensor histidine kinase [Bacillus piscicola]|uniref:sensor histidine kinase n=1 Tax=Bacillus piscicola TaxID=1632684 RepID=UPI001F092F92|nr:sensor histidine kinase [Bacillus piscicola]
MKLFLKDHLGFLILHILQFGLIFFLLWLDGYQDVRILFYVLFLSVFFLSCYLVYRYIRRRSFYTRLERPFLSLDESLEKTEREPLAESLSHLLKSQYKLYEQRISETEARTEEHLTFLDHWVHQMKTPLSVIELMAQDLDEPESSSIREETDRMKTGLETVLYMARLRTIEQDFRIAPVAVEPLVQDVNRENKRYFIRNKVYPKLSNELPGMTVETDEKWLRFMTAQLIQNAVKYSTGKSERLLITLSERDGSAVLEVQDFGAGIPKVDQRRIFNAFFTGENGRHYRESTGMGLFLVKEAADYLGHSIEMESTVGEGTTFRIVFSPAQNLTTM